MRFKISPFINEEDSNVTFSPNSATDAIAAERATIERDFSALAEQQPRLLHLALNEAEALAWESGFPELVFPLLAQEKVDKVASWHDRQRSVRQTWPSHAFAA